jgi:hypothetical protein
MAEQRASGARRSVQRPKRDGRGLPRGVKSIFDCQTADHTHPSTIDSDRRASSPRVSSGPRACRSSCSSLPRRSVRNDRRFTAPAAPCASTWPPCAKAHGKGNKPRTQIVACVPHAMDFAACCITDRELSLASTPPGPHELSHGHALGPSARRVGVNRLSAGGSPTLVRNPQAFRPDIVAATASRCRVAMTIATRPSPERDADQDNCPSSECKNKKRTSFRTVKSGELAVRKYLQRLNIPVIPGCVPAGRAAARRRVSPETIATVLAKRHWVRATKPAQGYGFRVHAPRAPE